MLALLRILQLRQPVTAAEISAELEVSERTVYRDLATLAERAFRSTESEAGAAVSDWSRGIERSCPA